MRFYLRESKSPTFFNIAKFLKKQGWQKSFINFKTHFNEQNFQFDNEAAETLEFKHKLYNLVEKYCRDVMPKSYCINDSNYPFVLWEIAHQYYRCNPSSNLNRLNGGDKIDNLVWILKPSLLNNGKHIKIFQSLSEIETHFQQSDRLGGEQVLQCYITNPFLLDERKFSIRMFVVLSNYAGAYLYPRGYLNIALHRYKSGNFDDYRCHLTNEHLQEDEPNVIQVPTHKINIFKNFYSPIKSNITKIVQALRYECPQAFICNKNKTIAIFGFDYMLDVNYKPWLLEVNHGPWFPSEESHPLYNHLYQGFFEALISNFVVENPITAKKEMRIGDFEPQVFEPLNV